jgi:hypothetical protein
LPHQANVISLEELDELDELPVVAAAVVVLADELPELAAVVVSVDELPQPARSPAARAAVRSPAPVLFRVFT